MKGNIVSSLWNNGIKYNNAADKYIERLEEIGKFYYSNFTNREGKDKDIIYNFVQVLLVHTEIFKSDPIVERFISSYLNSQLASKVYLNLKAVDDIINRALFESKIYQYAQSNSLYLRIYEKANFRLYSNIHKILHIDEKATDSNVIIEYFNSVILNITKEISEFKVSLYQRCEFSTKILTDLKTYLAYNENILCTKLVQSHINCFKSRLIIFKIMENLQVLNNQELKIESFAPLSVNYYKELKKALFEIYDNPDKEKRDYFSECAEYLLDIFQLNPTLYLKNEEVTEIIRACLNPSIYFEFIKRFSDILTLKEEIYKDFTNLTSEKEKNIYIYTRAIVSFIYNRDNYLCINEEGKVLRSAKAVLELNDLLDKPHNGKLLCVLQNFFSRNDQLKEYEELLVKVKTEDEKKSQAPSENSQISRHGKSLPSYVQQLAQERRGFEQYSARM